MKAPTPIDLSPEAVTQLKLIIQRSNIDSKSQLLLIGLIDFSLWLQFKLLESKISISRLKSLFGVPKSNQALSTAPLNEANWVNDQETAKSNNLSDKSSANNSKTKKRKGHGRNSAQNYTGAIIEKIVHPTYQPGNLCPTECGGKLYLTKAGQFIRVQGGFY